MGIKHIVTVMVEAADRHDAVNRVAAGEEQGGRQLLIDSHALGDDPGDAWKLADAAEERNDFELERMATSAFDTASDIAIRFPASERDQATLPLNLRTREELDTGAQGSAGAADTIPGSEGGETPEDSSDES
jgi:hypothetical protein